MIRTTLKLEDDSMPLRFGPASVVALLVVLAACTRSTPPDAPSLSAASAPSPPRFDPWIDGTGKDEPAMQVQQIDPDSFAIRQSFSSSAQAPFLYLLFGSERAMLIDTGDPGAPVRDTIDGIIRNWLRAKDRAGIPLVVAHSHSHSDHHAGDAALADRPDTTIVGLWPEQVAKYFQISRWPEEIVSFDLGNRVLDVVPTPGHEDAHIVFYDRRTGVLFSGDVLLPGHVLIPFEKFATFVASLDRLADFAAGRQIAALLGGHVELSTNPGEAFGLDAKSHPNEHGLVLHPSALPELQAALHAMADNPKKQPHDHFVITPLPHKLLVPYELPATNGTR